MKEFAVQCMDDIDEDFNPYAAIILPTSNQFTDKGVLVCPRNGTIETLVKMAESVGYELVMRPIRRS